ncbi:MAG: galactokinase [Vicinamibacteria bacterium]|nr:galactokinase [Vicinamibacteria bacterium]
MFEPKVPPISRASVVQGFRKRYGADPESVVRAPGRVNLIGEHTDYNDGFVMPMAIDRWVWMGIRRRNDRWVRVRSIDLDAESSFALGDLEGPEGDWIDYAKGLAWALAEDSHVLSGFDALVSSSVPVGAGLSSSAAFEMAVARAFVAVSDMAWDPLAMARAGQRAENEWVGVNCGIMDQLISAGGRAGHAILIDCRSLEMTPVPLPRRVAVVVLDTSTRRELAGSEYNDRRTQCSAAAVACGATSLRDVSPAQLDTERAAMGDASFRRAQHVVSETNRTLSAGDAMLRDDVAALGRLMNESHRSLRDDFEVSTPALDAMVEAARAAPGCLGARLTGAGFGGCVVALVAAGQVEAFVPHAGKSFTAATGLTPTAYLCEPVAGAEIAASD